MINEQNFTVIEVIEDLIYTLDYFTGYYCDLHHETFNTDYYIMGTYKAKQALESYGVFDAMDKIQRYEKDNFGDVLTDLSDPERVANMLYYIISEELIMELSHFSNLLDDKWNEEASEDTNQQLIELLKVELEKHQYNKK